MLLKKVPTLFCFLCTGIFSAEPSDKADTLVFGLSLRFISHTEAVVTCATQTPCSIGLQFGPVAENVRQSPTVVLDDSYAEDLTQTVSDTGSTTLHEFHLKDLKYRQMYAYRIIAGPPGREIKEKIYAFDNALNYLHAGPDPATSTAASSLAHSIVNAASSRHGFCLVFGSTDPAFLEALAAYSMFSVVGITQSRKTAGRLRSKLYKKKTYGRRIKITIVEERHSLPFPDRFANLIVISQPEVSGKATVKELLRILRPAGGVCLLRTEASPGQQEKPPAYITSVTDAPFSVEQLSLHDMRFLKITRGPISDGGSWTHQYGDAANTANSGGTLSGATSTTAMQVQWLGNPEGDFGLDRNPRMPPPLAIKGRLFHQGMNRIAALDSYNGAVLWTAEIPDLRRVNMPHDTSNWCADAASLFVAVKDRLWIMDQKTGALKRTVAVPLNRNEYRYDWGYIAQAGEMFYGSAVPKGSAYTGYWGKTNWYDGTSGPGTHKVASTELYGFRKTETAPAWRFQGGRIINSTISAAESHLFAAGSDSPSLQKTASGRITSPDLWKDMFLLCLDGKTGALVWKKNIKTVPGLVVYFGQCSSDAVIITSSASGSYHLYAYAQKDGTLLWHASHPWTGNNHSGHMQHPVIVGGKIFLEPCGYDLRTGKRTTTNVGRHEGCATYCGTKEALIYRGKDRRVSMWDIKSERVTSWINLRPSCWLSTITADGLILAPEGGGGCSCGKWIETSVVFSPRLVDKTPTAEKE